MDIPWPILIEFPPQGNGPISWKLLSKPYTMVCLRMEMGLCLSGPKETGRGRLYNSRASFQFAINDVPTSAESFVCIPHQEYSTVPLSVKFHLLLPRPGGWGWGGGHPIMLRANLRHRETHQAHGWRPVELLRSCQVPVLTSPPQSCPAFSLSIIDLDQNINSKSAEACEDRRHEGTCQLCWPRYPPATGGLRLCHHSGFVTDFPKRILLKETVKKSWVS